jgi:hypothetical protein
VGGRIEQVHGPTYILLSFWSPSGDRAAMLQGSDQPGAHRRGFSTPRSADDRPGSVSPRRSARRDGRSRPRSLASASKFWPFIRWFSADGVPATSFSGGGGATRPRPAAAAASDRTALANFDSATARAAMPQRSGCTPVMASPARHAPASMPGRQARGLHSAIQRSAQSMRHAGDPRTSRSAAVHLVFENRLDPFPFYHDPLVVEARQ